MKTQDIELQRNLGNKIYQLRTEAGMNLSKLAGRADLPTRTVQRAENGESSVQISTLKKIAYALNTTMSNLVKGLD